MLLKLCEIERKIMRAVQAAPRAKRLVKPTKNGRSKEGWVWGCCREG
eukprot:SAG11_NODE_19535_length_464_cov_2.112329_2_plen_46_part_01